MGLIQRIRHRGYVWSWRARYWWLDTRAGAYAHWCGVGMGILIVILQLIRMTVAAANPPPPGEPVKAIYWWVVQLIIVIVAAAVAYSMRPKHQPPAAQEGEAPTTRDGMAVIDCFGEVWIPDEFLLCWKVVGKEPIRTKGGKK